MKIIVLLLFISQINAREKHSVNIIKRDVHSTSLQHLNRYTKTFETNENIIFDTPNFSIIDSSLSIISKSSVREHTTWLICQLSLNNTQEIARYDSIQNRFILNPYENYSYTIDVNTGQLTLINTNDENFLVTEISLHAETGLSKNDDIIHDIYRLIRLSTTSINCTTNLTIDRNQSIELTCSIEYEFVQYDDLNNYQPVINLKFYRIQNNSMYIPIDQIYLNEIKDLQIENKTILNWQRSIIYTIKPINQEEYVCIVIPDSSRNKDDLFQDNNRICRTKINIKNENSSTVIFTRLNQWNLIDIFIIVLIALSSLLFIISLILCLTTRQSNKKRIVQIKPENKIITLPIHTTEKFFSNNNEIPLSESSLRTFSSQHKPGCPKYIPSAEYNFLSNDLFTHTTIDNIKKIILPDIPQNNEVFDDQTYIHFYIPSKNENSFSNKD